MRANFRCVIELLWEYINQYVNTDISVKINAFCRLRFQFNIFQISRWYHIISWISYILRWSQPCVYLWKYLISVIFSACEFYRSVGVITVFWWSKKSEIFSRYQLLGFICDTFTLCTFESLRYLVFDSRYMKLQISYAHSGTPALR